MASETLKAGIATLSWIDPKTGLPEVDKKGDPGLAINRPDILEGRLYRFSNFIEAYIQVDKNGLVQKANFTEKSGMYRGPSAFGLSSAPVGKIGRSVSLMRDRATFRQIVGSRTESPEKIGAGAGGIVGAIGGGAIAGIWLGPVGMFVGAAGAGAVGYFSGREIAELVSAFPPIWTELELTIHSSGKITHSLLSHSLFPSTTFYAQKAAQATHQDRQQYERQGISYDGDQLKLSNWKTNGWGISPRQRSGATQGNPWGMSDAGKVLGRGVLLQQCPVGYNC